MHGSYRENRGLEDADLPADLGHSPADLVVLSLSDSDLGAFATAWAAAKQAGPVPSLRLANLGDLQHPLSVDLYLDQTLQHAKGILVRLIGGVPYWGYGLTQVEALARRRGLALAVVPADGRPDQRLTDASTVSLPTLARIDAACAEGGLAVGQALHALADAVGLATGGLQSLQAASSVPSFGWWSPSWSSSWRAEPQDVDGPGDAPPCADPTVALVFYRSFLVADDLAPIASLFEALARRNLRPVGMFVPSLKMPEAAAWLREALVGLAPAAIVNATSFSGQGPDGTSPLEVTGAPVFQVALSTAPQRAWAESLRGLSPVDLAMHVVLPEVDGRIFAGIASFKERGAQDPHTEFARVLHTPRTDRIEAIVDRVQGWMKLAATPRADRRVALVLSTYPGRAWNVAHAVGLDAVASVQAMLEDLAQAGYTVAEGAGGLPVSKMLAQEVYSWSLADYEAALGELPPTLRDELCQRWGAPGDDPAVVDGAFRFAGERRGQVLVLLQPERGEVDARDDEYHDMAKVPRHGYVAFYLWLRQHQRIDALVHVGAHGTLEWLPGKSVALSAQCWPGVLTGGLPVIYPFIVNDPGEAAQAKRRIGAVTLGHVPPPLGGAGVPEGLRHLEALLDEFSNADGLHPKRRQRLRDDIVDEAHALGLERALRLEPATTPSQAVNQIDRFVCDVKDGQFLDGLHVYGRAPQGADGRFRDAAASEREGLLRALDGEFVPGGPSGSPYRGRLDVLPTGRNLFGTDPRSVPTPAAFAQGVKLAQELVRQHLQDEGDWPDAVLVDLWGSATMRTAGEEYAMALWLVGARPRWDASSRRLRSLEIVDLAELGRPRIDVTLRMSGLFRDVFPELVQRFDALVTSLADRDEPEADNPFRAAQGPRVYGPAPGRYGVDLPDMAAIHVDAKRRAAATAWLDASSWSYRGGAGVHDPEGIRRRVATSDVYAHVQDLPETDLLLAADYAAHEGGYVAAKAHIGGTDSAYYHLDSTDPVAPKVRTLDAEVARVVYVRATNPAWLSSMRRHGYRGAAEIASTLEHLAAFAELTDAVAGELLDAFFDATLGDEPTRDFLAEQNPGAYASMRRRFEDLERLGLWSTGRNAVRATVEAWKGESVG